MPPGTSWKGPLLGDWRAGGGAFRELGQGAFSEFEADHLVMWENFGDDVANAAAMETIGWTETAVGGQTNFAVNVTKENTGILLIDCGTDDDSGTNLQANLAPTAARISRIHKTIGPITASPTNLDNNDIILATKIGWSSEAAWDHKLVFGWVMTDTALMAPATGALTGIGTGGGVGFHFDEAGDIYYFTQRTTYAANFAEVDTGIDVTDPTQTYTVAADGKTNWMGYAIRLCYVDTSDDDNNGWCEFYMNPSDTPGAWVHVGTVVNNNPYTNTVVYSPTIEVISGDTAGNDVVFGFGGLLQAKSKYMRERSAPAI